MENKKLKAFGYARVSTGQQDLERQRTLIKECSIDKDYELVEIIKDDKISGAEANRDGLSKLMSLTKDVCDIVIISDLSRLSREDEIMEVLLYINLTIKKGIGILFLDDATKIYQDKLELMDIMRLAIGAELSAKERDKITERMKTGMDVKFYDTPNTYRGAALPLGFKAVDNPKYIPKGDKDFVKLYSKKIIVPDKTKTELINEVYNLVISGHTLREVAIMMNNRGLKTIKNKTYTESTISGIIKNVMYIGEITRNKKTYNLGYQIIDKERFNLANKRLKENQIFKNKGIVNFNSLKGIAKCPCGYGLMLNQINTKDKPIYFIMTCAGKKQLKEKGKCKNGGIYAPLFFESVWKTISLRLLDTDYHLKNNERIIQLNKEIVRLRDNIILFNKNIEIKESDKQRILNRLDTLTNTELIQRAETDFENKNIEIEAIIKQIKDTKNKIIEIESNIISIGNNYESKFYNEVSEQEKNEIYKSEIETVTYYSVTQYKGFIHINYKNGSENIIAVKKNKPRYSILLPHHFIFNIENRNVEYTAYEEYKGEGFGLGKRTTEILEFDNIAENNMGEYLEVEEKN